jgi:hypothetical protein
MTFGAVATLLVAVAFTALVVWVILPRNRDRLEDHGRIPLDSNKTDEGR